MLFLRGRNHENHHVPGRQIIGNNHKRRKGNTATMSHRDQLLVDRLLFLKHARAVGTDYALPNNNRICAGALACMIELFII